MPYPRLLNLGEEIEAKLRLYINTELFNHYAERSQWVDDLKRWQKDYWAQPGQKQKTFPFTGASNLVIPVTAISVEAIHARVMTTLFAFGDEQFTAARAVSPDWVDAAAPVEKFMDWQLLHKMKAYDKFQDSILEIEKLGTGSMKSGYTRIVKKAVKEVNGKDEDFDVVTYDGPTIDSPSIARFLMPFASQDPQLAPWCGEEHNKTANEVKTLAYSGMFYKDTYTKLESYFNAAYATSAQGQTREYEKNQEDLENRKPIFPHWLDFVELWMSYDVDDDGEDEEIVVHYHQPSNTFMSIRYNWYDDLHRPYRTGRYIKVEHRWAGLGIGKQCEQFMREITTIHRQRLDNATLANMRMIKINRLSGYGPKEPIFPGKMWFLDDMSHMESFQMSEVYQSSFENEQSSLIYSQQRTGVNEVTLGMPQVGTPGTATSDLTRVQEGSRKFDYVYKNIKQMVNEVITDVACNIQQFTPKSLLYYNTVEDGDLVRQYFSMPQEPIRDNLLLSIRSAGQQENKLLDRQNWQQIAQIYQMYGTEVMQLPIVQQNPQLSNMLQLSLLGGSTEAMKQMFQTFDIRNIDRILPIKQIEALVKNALGAVSQPTGNQGVAPIVQSGGVRSLPPSLPSGAPSSAGTTQPV